MRSIRIGNDIHVSWSIYMKDGLPYSLEEKDVRIFLATPYGRVNITDYTIHENVISWVFWGKSQKAIGNYSIILVVNKDNEGMVTTDVCDFVRLVSHSCETGGKDNDGVQTEAIELTSGVTFVCDDAELRKMIAALEEKKADKSELTELSLEVGGLSERIDNLPSGESDVFKAIYGTTTYEEVSEAYNQGKIIHCDYESRCYELAVFTGNIAWFSALNTTTSYLLMLTADSSWSKASYGLENTGNRVDTIQADAKPYQYPSAKAVYDFVQQSGRGGKEEVFWATEGITDASKGSTYDEILAAHNEGKVVRCYYNNVVYELVYITNVLYFSALVANSLYTIKVPQSNKWQFSSSNTEHKLDNLDNGNVQLTIAGKSAEVATPQYVEDAIQQLKDALIAAGINL